MALSIYVGDELAVLADKLAEQLSVPLPDPMQSELVAVPSVGLQRWLKLHLASTLGANGRGDGIAANIEMPFPGVLRSRLFAVDAATDDDPWQIARLVWAVHSALISNMDDPALTQIARLPDGGTWYGRARRIADLFDRYGTRRTHLLERWARSEDVDPTGNPLSPDLMWQPHLFRLVRNHLGVPSPAERLPALLRAVSSGQTRLDLPERFSIFGVSTLPGGQGFADLLKALGEHHQVDLFMLDPALETSRRLSGEFDGIGELKRAEDTSSRRVRQPLMRSWGRPSREAQLLLPRVRLPEPVILPGPERSPSSLLGEVQRHLRSDDEAAGQFRLDPQDRSITVHACHGVTRQVEALRDVILQALAADPSLDEADILVVSPDLGSFAAAIEGVFGPSAERPAPEWQGPERLSYTISDRELRSDDSLGAALGRLVGLIGGRYAASEILDFCRLPAVSMAYGFDGEALTQIESWLDATEIRWGLNQENRERNDVRGVRTNTWRHGLNQLLVGMAVHDDLPALGPNDVPAWGVESSGVDVLNRLIAMMTRLEALEDEWTTSAPIATWNRRLSAAVGHFFQLPFHEAWRIERARAAIAGLEADAELAGAEPIDLSAKEIAQMLAERLAGRSSRPRFFDGGITFTSTRPLRWVPHRMICVLGLNESAMSTASLSGDDLLGLYPDMGDPDRRADQRQALLELVLSARERLVIVREGHSVKSNQPVPPSIALAELLSELRAIVHSDDHPLLSDLEIEHSRHPFDVRNFTPGRPRSFDEVAMRAAAARMTPRQDGPRSELGERHEPVLDLGVLWQAILDGPKHFFMHRLQASFPRLDEGLSDTLPIEAGGLVDWSTVTQMLALERSNVPTDTLVATVDARGVYPTGPESTERLAQLQNTAAHMQQLLLREAGGSPSQDLVVAVSVDGVELVDTMSGIHPGVRIGPVMATASGLDERLTYPLWVRLCALTLADPPDGAENGEEAPWTAVGVYRHKGADSDEPASVLRLRIKGDSSEARRTTALRTLSVLLAIHRRSQCEPLPIHYKLSMASKSRTLKGWDTNRYPGVEDDVYTLAAFGRITQGEYLDMPCTDDDVSLDIDPPIKTRYERYAAVIAHLFENSVVEVDEADEGIPIWT